MDTCCFRLMVLGSNRIEAMRFESAQWNAGEHPARPRVEHHLYFPATKLTSGKDQQGWRQSLVASFAV